MLDKIQKYIIIYKKINLHFTFGNSGKFLNRVGRTPNINRT